MPPVTLMLLCCAIVIIASFCTLPVEASSTKLRIRFPQRIEVLHRHHTLHQYARRFPYGPLPPPAAAPAHKRRRLSPGRKASRPRRRRPAPYGLDYAGAFRSWTRAPGRPRRKRPKPPPPPPPPPPALSLHGYEPDGRETYQDQELRRDPSPYPYPYHYQYHNQYHGRPRKQPSAHWEKYQPYYEEYGDQQDEYPEGAYSEYEGQKAARYPPAVRYRKRPRRPPPPHGDDDADSDGSSPYSSHGYSQDYPGRRRRKRPPAYYPPFADEYDPASASGDDRMSASASAPSPATASPASQVSWPVPHQASSSSYLPGHQDSQLEEHWNRQYPNHRPVAEGDRWSQQYSNHRQEAPDKDSHAPGGWVGVGAEDRQWRPAAPAADAGTDADADIGYGEGLEDADGTVF